MRRASRTGLALAAIDLLSAIIVVSYRTPPTKADALHTEGEYAVVLSWAKSCGADLDLYVREPSGRVVFFSHQNGVVAHLEHDDIPSAGLGYSREANFERTVIRGILPGEYVVNVHVYQATNCKPPIPARVELWRLRGRDEMVRSQTLRMGDSGNEQTAFRFSLRRNGRTFGFNRLTRQLVGLG